MRTRPGIMSAAIVTAVALALTAVHGVSADKEILLLSREDFSLSALVLAETASLKAAIAPGLADQLPVTPIVRRTFRLSDRVSAFLRIRQRITAPLPVKVTSRIVNTQGDVFVEDVRPMELSMTAGYADYDLELPMFDFDRDEYTLVVGVAGGTTTAERAVRFRVE